MCKIGIDVDGTIAEQINAALNYLEKIYNDFKNMAGYMDDISTKAIKLDDKSGLKIFIN